MGMGPVGLSIANRLSSNAYFKNKSFLLLDKVNIFKENYSKPSPRVYSINKSSLDFLKINRDNISNEMKCFFKGMQIYS